MSIDTDGPIKRFGERMDERVSSRGRNQIRKAIALIAIGIVFLIMAFVPTADATGIEPPSFFSRPLLDQRSQDIMWYAMFDWYLNPYRDGHDLTPLRPTIKDFMSDGIITIFEWNDITIAMLPYRHGVEVWATDIEHDKAIRRALKLPGY